MGSGTGFKYPLLQKCSSISFFLLNHIAKAILVSFKCIIAVDVWDIYIYILKNVIANSFLAVQVCMESTVHKCFKDSYQDFKYFSEWIAD